MDLKGSRTEANLMAAFAGESQVRNKYTFFAWQAKTDGYQEMSKIFEMTAANEMAHAKLWFTLLHNGMQPTKENLEDAANGEQYEWSQMYADFSKIAKEEGFTQISSLFELVGNIEKTHMERYQKLLRHIRENDVFIKASECEWVCLNCGYIHKGAQAPISCPVCSHPQAYFAVHTDQTA